MAVVYNWKFVFEDTTDHLIWGIVTYVFQEHEFLGICLPLQHKIQVFVQVHQIPSVFHVWANRSPFKNILHQQ